MSCPSSSRRPSLLHARPTTPRRTFNSLSILLSLLLLLTLFLPVLSQRSNTDVGTDSDDTAPTPPASRQSDLTDSQQPLRPLTQLPSSNTTQRLGKLSAPAALEPEQTLDEDEGDLTTEPALSVASATSATEAAADESGFWLFEFVVVSVLVPAVWYWRKRKQYVTAMHHRRLDRMVNS